MKKSLIALFLICANYLAAQTFEVTPPKQPFYRIIEWKGQGSILMSRDPSFTQQQFSMQLLNFDGTTKWTQVMNPMVKEPHFISEDGGKYAYFLENLEPKGGKLFLHQLSAAGNIKTQNLNFLAAVKRLGSFPIDDLETVDIITTEKALVWLFRYTDKGADKIYTIAVSMTHHNFTLFAYLVAENVSAKSKIENQISWYICGEKQENIVFAARIHAGKEAGWKIKEFTPKGQEVSSEVLDQRGTNFTAHNRVGFGRRGSALLNRVEPAEKGTLVYADGKYFVGGVEVENGVAQLKTYVWENKTWSVVNSTPVADYNAKKELSVGYFRMNEGMGWYVRNTQGIGHFHGYKAGSAWVAGTIQQDTANPSRLLTADFPTKFVEQKGSQWLVFDYAQLPKKDVKQAVKFEIIQK